MEGVLTQKAQMVCFPMMISVSNLLYQAQATPLSSPSAPDPAGVNADDNGDEKPGLIMPEALMINSDNTGRESKNHMWQSTRLG